MSEEIRQKIIKKIVRKVLLLDGPVNIAENLRYKFEDAGFKTKILEVSAYFSKPLKMLENKSELILQINEFGPDIIVSSYAAGQLLSCEDVVGINKPFRDYLIMTDYGIPPILQHERCKESFIVVPTMSFKKMLEEMGYSPEQILPYGIPINEKFCKPLDKDEILASLQLSEFDKYMPTVLMMEGGKGIGNIAGVAKRLARNPGIQIITVCGANEKLKIQIDKMATRCAKSSKPKAKIYNFGHCTNTEEIMTIADFLVGSTDGITSTEAAAKGLQLVSLKKSPYPELSNLLYLESIGLAKSVKNIDQLEYYVALKPVQHEKSNEITEHSAEKIVSHVLREELTKNIKRRK